MKTTIASQTSKNHNHDHVVLVSGLQERILRKLATHKYLTVSQLVKLKVGIKNRIYEALKKLIDAKLVKFADYKALLRYGKQLERIHFLTPKGATLLVENTPNLHYDNIRYPKSSTTLFTHDYFHRVSTINTQISIFEWSAKHSFDLIRYDTYFDVIGSRKKHQKEPMHAVTRIEFGNGHFLDPDSIVIYQKPMRKAQILLIEVYNGRDTKRVIEQLRKHVYTVKHGLAASKYQLEVVTKVCCTFEHESNLQAVLKRVEIDPYFQFDGIEDYFFLGLHEKAMKNFETAFANLHGTAIIMSEI